MLGYETATQVAVRAAAAGRTVRAVVLEEGVMSAEAFDALLTPEAVCRLGSPELMVRKEGVR